MTSQPYKTTGKIRVLHTACCETTLWRYSTIYHSVGYEQEIYSVHGKLSLLKDNTVVMVTWLFLMYINVITLLGQKILLVPNFNV